MNSLVRLALLAAALLAPRPAVSAEPAPPNVVLIISDDQGFPDYGFMGSKIARTPNLDRMAAERLLYTRGYVMPVCSPSLACLLTGRLPHAHGVTGNDLAASAKTKRDRAPLVRQLLSNPVLLPKALTEAGYRTLQTGKLWNATAQEAGFTAGMTAKEGRHGGDGLDIGRKTMKPIFDFIADSQAQKKPFFVWYAPMMPHQPHNPPAELLAHYLDKQLTPDAAKYYAMVEWFDRTCGELDDHLKQNNLADNTVVIFLADNGWDANQGNRAKLSPYELGIRTPIFVRSPGRVKPLRDEQTLASVIDIVPTVLGAAGLPTPPGLRGVDLLDRKAMAARESVFVEAYTHDIQKLGKPAASLVTRVVLDGWLKLLLPGESRPDKAYTSAPAVAELYDLRADPFEARNLARERPADVARLTRFLDAEWKVGK